jgi:hypothetical protein
MLRDAVQCHWQALLLLAADKLHEQLQHEEQARGFDVGMQLDLSTEEMGRFTSDPDVLQARWAR